METGIFYALIAGLFWGMSPVLVKRGLAHASVSAVTLYQQRTILFTLACSALPEGDILAGKNGADLERAADRQFPACQSNTQGN
jgi:uncharacterized membrane protein